MSKRKVLIPLDGSEFSRQIVRVVRTFFDPKDVHLILFRAAFPPTIAPDVSPQDALAGTMQVAGSYEAYNRALEAEFSDASKERESLRTALMDALRVDAERLQQEGYKVDVEVHFGDAAQRIIDFVNDEDIDLVAMATHGRSGIGRLVLGSVAERVLRGVTVPVLLMRSVSEPHAQRAPGDELAMSLGTGAQLRIAVATDGSTLAQQAIPVALDLAQTLNAKLTVLAIASDRDPASKAQRLMEQVHAMVAHLEPRPPIVPLVGFADEVLLEWLSSEPTDLLIMGPFHDRGAIAATAIGQTAQQVVQHAPTSVWMVKGHRKRLRRILACVAVDDTVVVDVAVQLARATDADLTVLHVVPPSAASYLSPMAGDEPLSASLSLEEVMAQGTHLSTLLHGWSAQLERQGMSQDVLMLERGTVPESILRTAHDGHYDLVIVGSQSGPGHFLGSVANGVVRFSEVPVLLVRTRVI